MFVTPFLGVTKSKMCVQRNTHPSPPPSTLVVVFRCGFRTDAPSGGRRAPRSRAPRRPATRGRAGRPRRTRWRTRSTTSRWTRTLTTTRSDCCCANTAGPSPSCAWGRTTSDEPRARTHARTHTRTGSRVAPQTCML